MSKLADRIASWMRQHAQAAGAGGFVVGLSGGVDSAVVARLAQMATPGAVVGVLLPCQSDPQDEADAGLVAESFGLPTLRVDLGPAYDALLAQAQAALGDRRVRLPWPEPRRGQPDRASDPSDRGVRLQPDRPDAPDEARRRLALANIKPRLRMTTLYFVANSLNYLVTGTGNRSELAIGYYTKYGDGGVDLLPLGRLFKSEVRALAREFGVPDRIVDKAPTAGLWAGQTDEGELEFTYDDLERYLRDGPQATAPAVAARIERLIRASDHKRALPPAPNEY